MSVSLRRRWGEQWSVDAAAGFQQDLEELLTTELGPTTMLSKLKQVDGSGSGLDADTLDGFDSAKTATPNTVVVRDASGYSFAVYFNQSSAAENPTIGNVFVESGGDGYHRKISLTNFTAQLPVVSTTSQTPTPGSGAFTSVSATVTLERIPGEHFYRVQVQITITTNGTAAGFINVPLGITASKESVLAGRCAAVSGKMAQGIVAATTSTLTVTLYDNTYPGSSGERITLCGIVYV